MTAMFGFIVRTFNATKTIWSDDERSIEGYNGDHATTLHLFDTEQERDDALENVQVTYGENAERGDDCRTLWVGVLSDMSEGAKRLLFASEVGK